MYSPLYGQHPHRQPALRPGHSIGTDDQGSRVETFTLEGRLHRVDGPAVVKRTSIGVRIEERGVSGSLSQTLVVGRVLGVVSMGGSTCRSRGLRSACVVGAVGR